MNRLAEETSPYLRQHADNPVDWYPWGDEAFERARAEDRPILLSVGYSSCHWCHVMAHESFEDPEVAAVMNRLFVNIKVDREERPDVDAVYMGAVQAITGQGGWPMTVFLTPGGEPFHGGTYFPKESSHGRPGFVDLLEAVDDAWQHQRGELVDQATKLTGALRNASVAPTPGAAGAVAAELALNPELAVDAVETLLADFDARYGGFGGAPKFPQAMTLDFLIQHAVARPRETTMEMITTSLDAMAAGGLYDQVGGGFHRYSVDAFWLVPHFEKMLYDQALLVRTYLHAYLLTGEARYRRVVEETIGYVLTDLAHPDGGFFSSEDADSEGVEGKFYGWSLGEIVEVCGDDAEEIIACFGVTEAGNFTDPHTGFSANVLHAVDPTATRSAAATRGLAALARRRRNRVRPGLDDKVLTGWNALFLRALAEAAAALERDDWMDAARANSRFLLTALRRGDGRLMRSWQAEGGARHLAYAEDHAALIEALVTLAEVDDAAWITDAQQIAAALVAQFTDPDGVGFFTTGRDAPSLIVRPKELMDNAVPAENSLAAEGLLRLAAFVGDSDGDGDGEIAAPALAYLRWLAPTMVKHPSAFGLALVAYERAARPLIEVAIIGARENTGALAREVFGRVLPGSIVATGLGDADADTTALSPLLVDRAVAPGGAMAFVCEGYACRAPTDDPVTLRAQLDAALAARI